MRKEIFFLMGKERILLSSLLLFLMDILVLKQRILVTLAHSIWGRRYLTQGILQNRRPFSPGQGPSKDFLLFNSLLVSSCRPLLSLVSTLHSSSYPRCNGLICFRSLRKGIQAVLLRECSWGNMLEDCGRENEVIKSTPSARK